MKANIHIVNKMPEGKMLFVRLEKDWEQFYFPKDKMLKYLSRERINYVQTNATHWVEADVVNEILDKYLLGYSDGLP